MIKRRASLPSFNFRFVQEQESISIAKKDKTLIKVSDLFSRRKTFSSLRFMGTLGSFSLNLTSRLLRGRPNVRTFEVCFHILWNMKPKRWIWIQIRRVWWRHTFRGLRFESLDSCPTESNGLTVWYQIKSWLVPISCRKWISSYKNHGVRVVCCRSFEQVRRPVLGESRYFSVEAWDLGRYL